MRYRAVRDTKQYEIPRGTICQKRYANSRDTPQHALPRSARYQNVGDTGKYDIPFKSEMLSSARHQSTRYRQHIIPSKIYKMTPDTKQYEIRGSLKYQRVRDVKSRREIRKYEQDVRPNMPQYGTQDAPRWPGENLRWAQDGPK